MIDNLPMLRELSIARVRFDHVFQSWCFEFLRHPPLGRYIISSLFEAGFERYSAVNVHCGIGAGSAI